MEFYFKYLILNEIPIFKILKIFLCVLPMATMTISLFSVIYLVLKHIFHLIWKLFRKFPNLLLFIDGCFPHI